MYQALLTRRYLTTKLMPLLAALAVMLCTAMVLIVWSIMGGFLTMLLASGRSLVGDVKIHWSNVGFRYYEDLVQRLERDDAVAGATPMIETFGLVKLPDGRIEGVYVKGVDPESYASVVDYEEALWWKWLDRPLPKDFGRDDPRLNEINRQLLQELHEDGLRLAEPDPATGELKPAVVLGIEVTDFNKRHPGGYYTNRTGVVRPTETGGTERIGTFMPEGSVTLHVPPISSSGRTLDFASRIFPVANEFRSGVFEIDSRTVLVNLDALQRMLKMDAAERIDPDALDPYDISVDAETGEEAFSAPPPAPPPGTDQGSPGGPPGVPTLDPGRVTTVLVRAAEGVTPVALRARCEAIYKEFAGAHAGEVPDPSSIRIMTWKESQGTLVAAVEKEIVMVLFILGFVSVTASFLILAIFWAMVSEKTKDIGVLRSLGASKLGVAWLWLRYGLVIGVIGSLLGGLAAHVIIWNINPIHDWLGRALGVTIWDPKVYYFTEIPSQVDPWRAALVVLSGLTFSVLGALIPAWRAANMDPVQALRFE